VDGPPDITSPAQASARTGAAFSFQVVATGYPKPTFARVGPLPTGVSLSPSGMLSGTPPAGTGGSYVVTIVARNSAGEATQRFTLVVDGPPDITSPAQASARTGAAFSFQVVATGYPAATFTQRGSLPKGVTLSPSGRLSGTPVATGSYTFVITATNASGTAHQSFTLKVLRG